jgi:hypothetical protein
MQLNLQELPVNLFYERWKKNPSEERLVKNYIQFISSNSTLQQLSNNEDNSDQDYQYMLTRLLQKIKRYTTQNPSSAKNFYISLNKTFTSESEKVNQVQSTNLKEKPTIENPLKVRGKGRPSTKRNKSVMELNNKKKKISENNESLVSENQKEINPFENSNSNTQLQFREIQNFDINIRKPLHEIQNINIDTQKPLHEIDLELENLSGDGTFYNLF